MGPERGRTREWRGRIGWVAALIAGLGFAACAYDPLADGLSGDVTCHDCHGSTDNPAPPVSVDGATDTAELAVGAHQSHLTGSEAQQSAMCAECHIVPSRVDDEGHVDALPAEVTFGSLARQGGLTPEWDRAGATCRNVYCHGAGLADGGFAPQWTVVDGTQAACGTCHGLPPETVSGGGAHPPYTNCWTCHPDTVKSDGTIDETTGTHVDGQVEVADLACNTCHGDETSPAPPPDTSGNTDTTAPGVGAHRSHLDASDWHAQVSCEACHVVPQSMPDPGHVDSALPAEVTFGDQATGSGTLEPVYDYDDNSCSQVYCHGYSLYDGGPPSDPVWTEVGVGTANCGTCHGLPPAEPHVQIDTCVACHSCVVDDNNQIIPENAYLHINGTVNLEAAGSCPEPP